MSYSCDCPNTTATDIRYIINYYEEKKRLVDNALKSNPNIPIVFVIGNNASGKSSVIASLLQKEIKISSTNRHRFRLEGYGISNNFKNTEFPQIEIDEKQNIIYCEIPSYYHEQKIEIFHTYPINKLFIENKEQTLNIKVLLVMSQNEIDSCKGQGIASIFRFVSDMFPNNELMKENAAFTFTKIPSDIDNTDLINMLDDIDVPIVIDWNKFLLSHSDHIFLFPNVDREDVGKNYIFNDRDRLLSFLKVNFLTNKEINCPIKNDFLLRKITEFIEQYKNQVFQSVQNFLKEIENDFQNEQDVGNVNKNIEIIEKMSTFEFKHINEFKDMIKTTVFNHEKYKDDIDNINDLEDFYSFLEDNLKMKHDYSSLNNIVHQWGNKALETLKKEEINLIK